MSTQDFMHKPVQRWYLLPSLMLLLIFTLSLAFAQPVLAAPSWQSQVVDSTGDVGTFKALVLDSSGNPVISYYDETNADLKLVHCGNPICTLKTIQVVDSAGDVGAFNSLVLDSNGNPVISYFDYINYKPKLVHCGNATCSSGNTIVTLDTGTLGQYTSLALDSSGNPVIGYNEAFQQHVKVAHCGNATCTSGNSFQIAASSQSANYLSLALDSGGKPVVSYYSSYPNFVLRLVHCGNTTCSSGNTVVNVDSSVDVGLYNSIKLDNSGNPVISYYDNNNDDLKLVHCGNANCSAGNSIVTIDNAGDVGRYTSLALDNSGRPVISYYDLTNGNLKVVQCGNTNCTSGNTFQTVDSTGDVGQYTALRLDSSGAPVIAYYDVTNGDLKLARLVNDAVAPTGTPSQSPAANANGWNKTDVTVNWNWTDNAGGSGLDTAHCPSSSTSSGEGTQTLTATCYDRTGNATSASYTVKVDKTAPAANPAQSPPAGVNGWTETDVTVTWNWTDSGSGRDLTHCTTSSTSSGEGVQTLTATCQDKAGNTGTASYTAKVDKTGPVANPTLSPPANAAGWNNTNVTVNWNWTDSDSGLDTANCTTSSTSNVGVGSQTLTAYCVDQVGNLTSASYTVKVDRAWPQIQANVSPSPSSFGWYNGVVTVNFTCQEQGTLSGLATNTVGGNVTMSNEGTYPAVTNTGSCTDIAGNVATTVTVGPINIDLTKPTISAAATTQPNVNGWYNSDATVHFTCTDALAGIAFCSPDQLLSNEGTAVSSTAQTGRDKAQNLSDPSNVVTVKLDKTAPTVSVTGVTNGATYPAGSVPTAACTTSDALSGVATPATLNVTPNPNQPGSFTATCSGATDLAGNSTTPVTATWTIAGPNITVSGNQQPIVNGSTTPTTTNGTNLGDVLLGSALTQTFTLANQGSSLLSVSGNPRVAVGGPQAADFTIVTLPAASVAAGSSTTFQVRFTPSAVGVRTATLTIANNDSSANPYTFAIQGAGLQALQPTSQLTQLPGYTQTCVAASAPYVKRCTLSFTLKNTSNGPLQIRYEQLTKVSSHIFVLNGTPNPGQVGTIVTDARSLAVNATFPPTFQLGLTSSTAYSLFFKVYGYPGAAAAAGVDDNQAVELGEFAVTVAPAETAATSTIFLPLINR
ncbi:MAG: choice-of-anchor D domain-containing protein [Caldilineaceae bacterium]